VIKRFGIHAQNAKVAAKTKVKPEEHEISAEFGWWLMII